MGISNVQNIKCKMLNVHQSGRVASSTKTADFEKTGLFKPKVTLWEQRDDHGENRQPEQHCGSWMAYQL